MNMTNVSTSGILFILMSGFLDASGVGAVYEPIVSERAVTQPEKMAVAEASLDFRIGELVERTRRSGCAAAQRVEQDRRQLDPQLSASDSRNVPDSASQDRCNEPDSRQPGQAIPISIKTDDRSGSIETPSHSLKHASILLHRAASVIEKDDTLAVQLIRQVISILKHHVIPSLLDRNSTLLPISSLSGLAEQGLDHEGLTSPIVQSPFRRESSIPNERGNGHF